MINQPPDRHCPIECKTGVWADAANGRRLVYDEEKAEYVPVDTPTKYVNQHANPKYYTETFEFSGGKLFYTVYHAKDISKHGLQWEEVFEAIFDPKREFPSYVGENKPEYWLTGGGTVKIYPYYMPDEKGARLTLRMIASLFWGNSVAAFLDREFHCSKEEMLVFWSKGKLLRKIKEYDPIKEETFGVEIEFTGMRRLEAAMIIADYFHTEHRFNGRYCITDKKGRLWKVVDDSSIQPTYKNGDESDDTYRCELVTPILRYGDIPALQQIVRELRKRGMRVNKSCGIHVHIGSEGHTPKSVTNLANLMASKEELIFKAVGAYEKRIDRYCQRTDRLFIYYLNNRYYHSVQRNKEPTMDDVKRSWYYDDCGTFSPNFALTYASTIHYHDSRYHAFNLHSFFQNKGIEFRMFNSTTHAGKLKAYIHLCMAMSCFSKQHAENIGRVISYKPHKCKDEGEYFSYWLRHIGLTGDEFKTARLHLLANFENKNERRNVA